MNQDKPKENSSKKPNSLNIPTVYCLSMDGGGMKGRIPARYIEEIEKNFDGTSIYKFFDYAGGTSTGGIIIMLITIPGENGEVKSGAGLGEFYENYGQKIFKVKKSVYVKGFSAYFLLSASLIICIIFIILLITSTLKIENGAILTFCNNHLWILTVVGIVAFILSLVIFYDWKLNVAKFSPEPMETACDECFSAKTTLADAKIPICILAVDKRNDRLVHLNSIRAKKYPEDLLHGALIKKICRSASAADTYFPPEEFINKYPNKSINRSTQSLSLDEPKYKNKKIFLKDAGIFANNPAAELRRFVMFVLGLDNTSEVRIKLLSFSTGTRNGNPDPSEDDESEGGCCFSCKRQDGGVDDLTEDRVLSLPKKIDIEDYEVDQDLREEYEKNGRSKDYIRINFSLDKDQTEMDNSSKKILKKHIQSAEKAIFENGKNGEYTKEFQEVLDFLNPKYEEIKKRECDTQTSNLQRPRPKSIHETVLDIKRMSITKQDSESTQASTPSQSPDEPKKKSFKASGNKEPLLGREV